jgi:hypothetical protein
MKAVATVRTWDFFGTNADPAALSSLAQPDAASAHAAASARSASRRELGKLEEMIET